MADPAHEWTDERLAEIDAALAEEYRKASETAARRAEEFARSYEERCARWREDVAAGRRDEAEFKAWREAQAAHAKWCRALADRLAADYAAADARARGVADDAAAEVAAENVNWAACEVEAKTGGTLAFSLYDAGTVRALADGGRPLMPARKAATAKDEAWNRRKVASAVTQSVLLGEPVPKLAKRLQTVCDMDRRAAQRAARTTLTGAENAGRLHGYGLAQGLGVPVRKQWLATLDGRTRSSHRALDGETVDVDERFSNGCECPGDPHGPASEVWNCRCTLVAAIDGIDDDTARPSRAVPDRAAWERWKQARGGSDGQAHASGRSVKAFLAQRGVRRQLEARGVSEARARRALADELRAMGYRDGRSFPSMSRKEQRDAWRQALAGMNETAESGITSKRNTYRAGKVDVPAITSPSYVAKFKGLTGNPAVDKAIALECRRMLVHRTGTATEDLSLINRLTGEVVARSSGTAADLRTSYNSEVEEAIARHSRGTLVSVHNHPSNVPPTGSDFGSAISHGYAGGVVALHNGEVYAFELGERPFNGVYFDLKVQQLESQGKPNYSAILDVMRQLSEMGCIRWTRF